MTTLPGRGIVEYYGIDRSLKTVEHGAVSLEQAMGVIDARFLKLKPKYETGEEALAETMFGFHRAKDTFVEICINGPAEIAFKFEHPAPKLLGIFRRVYRNESKLLSKEELKERVASFFNTSTEEYERYVESFKR